MFYRVIFLAGEDRYAVVIDAGVRVGVHPRLDLALADVDQRNAETRVPVPDPPKTPRKGRHP